MRCGLSCVFKISLKNNTMNKNAMELVADNIPLGYEPKFVKVKKKQVIVASSPNKPDLIYSFETKKWRVM